MLPVSNQLVHRRLVIAVNLVVLLVAGVTVGVAIDDGGYIYLTKLAHPFIGIGMAGIVAATTGHIVLSRRIPVTVLRTLGAFTTLTSLVLGVYVEVMTDMVEPAQSGIAARSSAYTIVTYRYPGLFNSGHIGLRLRTRAGLVSQEAAADLACFAVPSSGAGPEWLLDKVQFVGPHEIEIRLRDGTTTVQTFDPRTLKADRTVDCCTDAPDPAGAD
jgi:hypothetical protein